MAILLDSSSLPDLGVLSQAPFECISDLSSLIGLQVYYHQQVPFLYGMFSFLPKEILDTKYSFFIGVAIVSSLPINNIQTLK